MLSTVFAGLSKPQVPQAMINWALASNGGVASASSDAGSEYYPSFANNGDRIGKYTGYGGLGQWASANVGASTPKWLQMDLSGPKVISRVNVIGIQDDLNNPVEPTLEMTWETYGNRDFEIQWWDGSAWQTAASVTFNNKVWRQVDFAPVTTDKIRLYITYSSTSYAYVAELEAWGN